MNKILLLLALLAFSPLVTQTSYAFCETYEPYCDGEERGDNDDSDDAEPQRPADPNGPDYEGGDGEI